MHPEVASAARIGFGSASAHPTHALEIEASQEVARKRALRKSDPWAKNRSKPFGSVDYRKYLRASAQASVVPITELKTGGEALIRGAPQAPG